MYLSLHPKNRYLRKSGGITEKGREDYQKRGCGVSYFFLVLLPSELSWLSMQQALTAFVFSNGSLMVR